jgi:hypothetical protein
MAGWQEVGGCNGQILGRLSENMEKGLIVGLWN